MSTTIRRATNEDMPWLLGQLAEFNEFFGSSHSLFPSLEYAEQMLATLVATQPFLVAHAEGCDQERVGFIAGALAPHPYNPAIRVLSEMFWWVDPKCRGSRAGLQLLNAFVALGRERADWVVMTLEHESPVNPETLTRRGFRPKETSYLMEVA